MENIAGMQATAEKKLTSSAGSANSALKGSHQISSIFGDQRTVDIHFEFIDIEPTLTLSAHKHILAAESPIFCNIFSTEPKLNTIPITNVLIDQFVLLLKSFYGVDLPITMCNVNDLLELADKYQAKCCIIKCIDFLKESLNAENVCFVLDVAWKSSWMALAAVHESCINIVYEHFDTVIKTSAFTTCRTSTLQTVLSQHPSSRHEFDVVAAVVKWAQNVCEKLGTYSSNPQNLRKVIGANFNLIDFSAMTEIDFFTCQFEHRLLTQREIREYMDKK